MNKLSVLESCNILVSSDECTYFNFYLLNNDGYDEDNDDKFLRVDTIANATHIEISDNNEITIAPLTDITVGHEDSMIYMEIYNTRYFLANYFFIHNFIIEE